uniref:Uncharacterized protein n=3 Tax=Klebsiella TaxID=570 RepID=A0A345WX99_KLEOX|nr:Hypothetical protein [Klebsiella aerogenes]AXJ98302.1 hypothetical protein [Klebsiella oxytoca]AXJ98650.1 hypothetical protein [Klebsiella pneumoniae]QAX88299.1 hypothetical protein [Klebsiella pneumoniae]QEQ70355.1 hypothetical protein [Klebsiella pneumoniae]
MSSEAGSCKYVAADAANSQGIETGANMTDITALVVSGF